MNFPLFNHVYLLDFVKICTCLTCAKMFNNYLKKNKILVSLHHLDKVRQLGVRMDYSVKGW